MRFTEREINEKRITYISIDVEEEKNSKKICSSANLNKIARNVR